MEEELRQNDLAHVNRRESQLMPNEHVESQGRGSKRLSQASANSGGSRRTSDLKTTVGPWQLGMDLGMGMSANVRKARHMTSGELVAVKIVNLKKATKLQTQSILAIEKYLSKNASTTDVTHAPLPMVLQREIAILKAINHPNVTRLIDIWENRGELYLFMEFVENGELLEYILLHHHLSEMESVRLFRQLISGVQYCHRFLLCHRDIKPENILLDKDYNLKLADFGMAAMHNNQLLRTSCGSPHYAAPEIVLGRPYKGNLADVWSCGIVLYAMMTGGVPFGGTYGSEQVQAVIREVLQGRLEYTQTTASVSWMARDLIAKILERNPARRIPLDSIWFHPLFRKYEHVAKRAESRKYWLGDPLNKLTEADCGPQIYDEGSIDKSVLEGLCTLWQTDDESNLVKSLLSLEPSYEKILYHCLRKYRIEQEENYMGTASSQLSCGDYHHVIPRHFKKSQSKISLLGPGSTGQQHAQFGIVQPGVRRTSVVSRRTMHSSGRCGSSSRSGSGRSSNVTKSETTYDPYRSSKPQVVYRGDPYTRVDVHRDFSPSSRASTLQNSEGMRRVNTSSIWQTTDGSSLVSLPMPSSPPELPSDTSSRVRPARRITIKRSYSKVSVSSSVNSQGSGRSLRFSKASSHKHSVSFRHLRDFPSRPHAPTPTSYQRRYLQDRLLEDTPELPTSPGNRRGPSGRSLPDLQASASVHANTPKAQRTPYSSANIGTAALTSEAAARASIELSRYCDVAFSSSSSRQRSDDDDVFVDSPTPAVNSQNAALAARLSSSPLSAGSIPKHILNKELPNVPPKESQAFEIQRKLMRVWQTLRDQEKELGPGRLDHALAEIERAMRLNAPEIAHANYQHRVASQERRVQSESNSVRPLETSLSPVKEDREDDSPRHRYAASSRRRVSEPLPQILGLPPAQNSELARRKYLPLYDGPTIRVVPRSPGFTGLCHEQQERPYSGVAANPELRVHEPCTILNRHGGQESLATYSNAHGGDYGDDAAADGILHTIKEHDDQDAEYDPRRVSSGSRLRNLFRRNSSGSGSMDSSSPRKRLSFHSNEKLNSQTCTKNPVSAATDVHLPLPQGSKDADNGGGGLLEFSHVDDWQDQMHHAVRLQPSDTNGGGHSEAGDSEFPSRGTGEKARERVRQTPGSTFWKLFRREKRDPMQLVEPGDADSVLAASSIGSHNNQSDLDASLLHSVPRSRLVSGSSGVGDGGHGHEENSTGKCGHELISGARNRPHATHPWPSLAQQSNMHSLQPTNWLARLLQVRPAIRTFAFEAYRTRMLKEIRGVFRDWRRYGVRDIVVEKSAGRIWARVVNDEDNKIANNRSKETRRFKSVEILVEVYAVVYKARSGPNGGGGSGMSIARMHQVRGARSSFDSCASQLLRIFEERGLLVADRKKSKEMKKCLKELRKP